MSCNLWGNDPRETRRLISNDALCRWKDTKGLGSFSSDACERLQERGTLASDRSILYTLRASRQATGESENSTKQELQGLVESRLARLRHSKSWVPF